MVFIKKYIVRRLLQLIPILIGITLLSFALMQSSKTDAVDLIYKDAGNVASEEVKEQIRQELGLDKPFIVQYTTWLGNVLKGDMGMSYVMKKPVFSEFMKRLPNTMALTITSIVVTFVVSVPLGILSAVKQNKPADYVIRFLSFTGNSLPGFFLSLILIYVFSLKLNLLPVMGNNGFKSIILPTLTLAISMSAKYTRQIRATVLEELNKDYV
ncbi:MAG: ABC transporter permease, partial [Clostridiales bacterium]|nr:ABC transporter permease [Clostridiales bacterium]